MMKLLGTYEPPLSEIGSPAIPGQEPLLTDGVKGHAIESKGLIYIPLVFAVKEGNGDVGRFIDSLSPRCVFPTVTSARFQGMLERRGYIYNDVHDLWHLPITNLPEDML